MERLNHYVVYQENNIVGQLYFKYNQINKTHRKKIIFVVTRGGGIGAEEIG